ncbi:uncharacterized protein Z518_03500 [Rhinocladiella mackenziei CBS 650.93]|uniref:Cyclase n=1 Tax=Rhinocladiella mackenziei CBS 650.93 TaxID=1442369 RepID=A0A0D2HE50_9EURO|nr:uncharacterized protein Z518_03500 [Rhinocladiella mackenziei CBS 650.93]KIX08843.1 hypothetical protein Z518_03500 [Rhinocladiella mackenziei CBS 650.93]
MIAPGDIPEFDSLPKVGQMPQGCAWGLFDSNCQKDRLGCLNFLTPEVVQRASKEVRDGVSISLNWPMGAIRTPPFGRKGLGHKIHTFKDSPYNVWSLEDEVEFNTQSSSQWDSLVHFYHQPTGLAYNGIRPVKSKLAEKFENEVQLPTLDLWHARGGMAGRGVLLDYRAWAEAKGISYNCFDSHIITISDLESIAEYQGTKLLFGDILVIRSGYTEDLGAADADEQQRFLNTGRAIGIEGNINSAKWIWNHHFSAVAGDMLAFEVTPPRIGNREGGIADLVLHQYLLGLFGVSIGELWDLKTLGEYCKKAGRYEFFLTSVPLNIPGLVASPPNALAIL